MNRLNTMSLCLTVLMSLSATAADKIDWGVCKVDLQKTGCDKKHDDHEKHECLEKKGKKEVSEPCIAHNEEVEKNFKGKHKGNHKH